MIAVVTGEMVGSDWVPSERLEASRGRRWRVFQRERNGALLGGPGVVCSRKLLTLTTLLEMDVKRPNRFLGWGSLGIRGFVPGNALASIDCEFPTPCLFHTCGAGQCAACPKCSVCGQANYTILRATVPSTICHEHGLIAYKQVVNYYLLCYECW